jgi:hypothetical protein
MYSATVVSANWLAVVRANQTRRIPTNYVGELTHTARRRQLNGRKERFIVLLLY